MTIHRGLDLTDAIVEALEADGWIVGRSLRPKTPATGWQGAAGASAFIPYIVVHPTPGGYFTGSISDPFGDAQADYIIQAFGGDPRQAQLVNDAVFRVLTTTVLVVDGRQVQLAIPDVDGGVVRDDDVQPPVFYTPTRWRILTTTDGSISAS